MDVSTPTSTVTPSSESPAAAPATSAPTTTSVSTERPATFAEAFARDAAPTTETPVTPEGTATTEPVTATPPPSAPGPIPFDVHKTALENARTKAAEQAKAEFQQQYGWAQGLDRSAVEEAARMGQLYQQDRPAFIRQMLAEAITDPEVAPLVRSEAARVLAQRSRADAPPVDLSPDIPVMDANGQVVAQTFSADRVKQIVNHAIQEALGKELTPLKADYQSRQQREQAEQQRQELDRTVRDIYTEARDVLPGFTEHEAEIAKVFETLPVNLPADKALRMAWKQVVGGKLANAEQVKAQTITDLKTKAAASAVNPGAAVIPTTKRPTSFHDPALTW